MAALTHSEDVADYVFEVDLDRREDEAERKYLESLPTSLTLAPADVDRLVGAARHLLNRSALFAQLVQDLN